MPRRYSFAEDSVKKAVKATVHRGKTEVFISVENTGEEDVSIVLNTALAEQYLSSLLKLQELSGVQGGITAEYIASLPDVMKAVPDTEKEEEITEALTAAAAAAAEKHAEMRSLRGRKAGGGYPPEGRSHRSPRKAGGTTLSGCGERICGKTEEPHRGADRERSGRSRGKNSSGSSFFADKINVTEEVVRLRSHIGQLRSILADGSQPQGKKLDFLVQEMNREANTIGSKANDLEITSCVLEMKSEIEKIREQVQNIE